ncbi:MAG: sodium:solute symporter family protein [Planctomycetes bacterium]|nr:sodium:solute symporter family protein [Planctomycetota bacterium]
MPTNFTALDWGLIGLYLAFTLAIGFWLKRYIRGMGDFLVAGRALRSRLGIATMIGGELGLVTAMYAAESGFRGGFAAYHIAVVALFGALLVGATGLIVKPLRRLGVMTIPEFYERRFGSRGLRVLGGLLLALGCILNMGMFLRAGAIFVTGLTGMTDDLTVKLTMTVLILMVLLYTALGGMVSVIVTDFVQFLILSVGLVIACLIAVFTLGYTNILDTLTEVRGAAAFDPLHKEGFGGTYVSWQLFLAVISCAVWPTAVLRACSVESDALVKRLYTWSSIGFMIRFLIPNFLGVCAFCFLWKNQVAFPGFFDANGAIVDDRSLFAMPVFLAQILPAGLIGLVGAGMLAAFMSTHDTYLLSYASVLTQDVVRPLAGERLTDRGSLVVTRILLCVIAAFLLVWSLWFPLEQGLWDYLAITGAIYTTGAFAVLTMGLYWRKASAFGALLALLSGLCATLALKKVQELLGLERYAETLSIENVGLGTAALAFVAMIAGSFLRPSPAPHHAPHEEA